MSSFELSGVDRVRELVAGLISVEGPLLPILHEVRHAFGHVPDAAIPPIAEALNLARAEVCGVARFHHDFRRVPAGRHLVRLCRAEACQSMGGDALADALERHLGVGIGETRPDGQVTLEAVHCLGLCATAPSAMVDGRLVGRLDAAAVARIVEEVGA